MVEESFEKLYSKAGKGPAETLTQVCRSTSGQRCCTSFLNLKKMIPASTPQHLKHYKMDCSEIWFILSAQRSPSLFCHCHHCIFTRNNETLSLAKPWRMCQVLNQQQRVKVITALCTDAQWGSKCLRPAAHFGIPCPYRQ